MTPETGEPGVLGAAVHRLDRALAQLEVRVNALGQSTSGELFGEDRAQLASELDAARARERGLEAAGTLASEALARAIGEIRAALGEDQADEADDAEASGEGDA